MDDNIQGVKTCGYLEKKGKNKILTPYKRYWFILEGRLLLYYRSKAEYEAISPCKGSINLGPSCKVKPCASSLGVFQISNRSSTITLRAENREEQNRWMQSVIAAIGSGKPPPKLSHFRYSSDDIPKAQKQAELSLSDLPQNTNEDKEPVKCIIQRLQKMGAQTYVNPSAMQKLELLRKTGPEGIQKSEEKVKEEQRLQSKLQSAASAEHIYERLYPIEENKLALSSSTDSFLQNVSQAEFVRDLNENNVSQPTTHSDKSNDNNTGCDNRTQKRNSKSCDEDKKPVKVKKCSSFLRRVWERKNRKSSSYKECQPQEEVEEELITKPTAENMMLTELQNVLEEKIPHTKTDFPSDQDFSNPEAYQQYDIGTENEKARTENADYNVHPLETTNEQLSTLNLHHGNTSNCKTIDELLQELDEENRELKMKTMLAKRDENEFSEVVELRSSPTDHTMEDIDPDQLSKLLVELSKVTSAPLLKPGTSHSLMADHMKDSELLLMLPPKRRRHSEPDYDIPRPHKSMPSDGPKRDTETKIGSTRFFGPVLPSSYIQDANFGEDGPSMTPDSLETDIPHCVKRTPNLEDIFYCHMEQKPIPNEKSYIANAYLKLNNNNDYIIDNKLYDDPKLILKYTSLYDSPDTLKNEEVFIDSLEIANS